MDQSNCEEEFEDTFIEPKGAKIAKVLMQYDNYEEPFLCGLKFLDRHGKTLLVAGLINKASRLNNPNFPISEFTLRKGERIIGVTSRQSGEKYAQHYNLSFIVGHKTPQQTKKNQ